MMEDSDNLFMSLDHGSEGNSKQSNSQSFFEKSSSVFAESGQKQLETPTPTSQFSQHNISEDLLGKVPKDVEFWTSADVCGICFESVDQAEEFYRAYSVKMGFRIQRSNMITNTRKSLIIMRRWVCSHEGDITQSN